MIPLPFSKAEPAATPDTKPSSGPSVELGKKEDRRKALKVGGSALLALTFQTLGKFAFGRVLLSLSLPCERQGLYIPILGLLHCTF